MNKENVSQMAAFDNPLACNDEKTSINLGEDLPKDFKPDNEYDMWDEEDTAPRAVESYLSMPTPAPSQALPLLAPATPARPSSS